MTHLTKHGRNDATLCGAPSQNKPLAIAPGGRVLQARDGSICTACLEVANRGVEQAASHQQPRTAKRAPLFPSPCCGAESPIDGPYPGHRCGQCGRHWHA